MPSRWHAIRKRMGFVTPRRTRNGPLSDPAKRAEVARRYLKREKRQGELALEYDVSPATIVRCVAEYDPLRDPLWK